MGNPEIRSKAQLLKDFDGPSEIAIKMTNLVESVYSRLDNSEAKVQIVGSRGGVLGNTTNSTVRTDGTKTRLECRFKTQFGPSPIRDISFLDGGFLVTGSSPEVLMDNVVTIDRALEAADASAFAPVMWGNSATLPLAPGALVQSSVIPLRIPANGQAWIRTGALVTGAQLIPISSMFAISGESMPYSTEATSQVMATGTMVNRATGSTGPGGFIPLGILGIPEKPFPCVAIQGDSLSAGTIGDSSDPVTGARGYVQRGCVLSNGTTVPWVNLSRASETAAWNVGFSSYLRRSVYDYVSYIIIGNGTNDFAGGANLATVQNSVFNEILQAKASGAKVAVLAILPRTNAGNTVPIAGFEAGGIVDQFNTWLYTLLGTYVDYVINARTVLESKTTPGLWANGAWTSDGTHLNTVGAPIGAGPVRDVVSQWT